MRPRVHSKPERSDPPLPNAVTPIGFKNPERREAMHADGEDVTEAMVELRNVFIEAFTLLAKRNPCSSTKTKRHRW